MVMLKHYVGTNVTHVMVSVADGIDITIEIINDQFLLVKVEKGLHLFDIKKDPTEPMQLLH
jgi:hypothetical protein